MPGRFPLFGVALVLIGAAMLLDRTGVLSLSWPLVFWGAIALLGAFKLTRGFTVATCGGGSLFWGTVLLAVGLYNVLRDMNVTVIDTYLELPALVTTVGAGFLMMFIRHPRHWHILIPALFFGGLGTLMLLSELGYFSRWEVMSVVRTYWPIVLILFGASLLLSRGYPRKSEN
jgi:hypothetical protein